MARRKRSKWMMGAASALGAVGAFFGVRSLMNYMQRRRHDRERFERLRDRFEQHPGYVDREEVPPSPRYQPVDQPDRMPAAGMGRDLDAEGYGEGTTTGATHRMGEISREEREGIPATGMGAVPPDTTAYTRDQMVDTDTNLAMPLAQYLLTFYSMINLLHARRQSGGTGARSLNAEDVSRYSESLDRLREITPEMDRADFAQGSHQGQAYDLILKVRDALENNSYTDDDLFRINGEVKSMACRVLSMMPDGDTGTYLDQARRAFDCD